MAVFHMSRIDNLKLISISNSMLLSPNTLKLKYQVDGCQGTFEPFRALWARSIGRTGPVEMTKIERDLM